MSNSWDNELSIWYLLDSDFGYFKSYCTDWRSLYEHKYNEKPGKRGILPSVSVGLCLFE